ncbi:MAG TPA: ABC transporter substrate-binding protein [Sporichthyaceae bacterium]|nr:ABC transporter substrate-binding protein [Sporichthyaceae bacterium]
MRPGTSRARSSVAALTAVLLIPSLAACGSKGGGGSTAGAPASCSLGSGGTATVSPSVEPTTTALGGPLPTVTADPKLTAMVPAGLSRSGVMTVGTDSTYAPDEFLAADGHTVQGFDIDLLNGVAAKLGLKTSYQSATFDSIIPAVESCKYDFSVSSFTINADREKAVNMISYFSSGMQWARKTGSTAIASIDEACGKRVAAQTGTTEADDLAARSKTCTGAKKSAITVDLYQNQSDATAAVVSGKDDAMSADSQVTAYAVQQTGGKLATLGPIYASAPYGFVVKKGEETFAAAVSDAVNAMIADGTYKAILDHWGVSSGGIAKSEVNPDVTVASSTPSATPSSSASPSGSASPTSSASASASAHS